MNVIKSTPIGSHYSVLLLYPDFMDEGLVQTYLAHVFADNVDDAIELARLEVAGPNQDIYDAEDLDVLICVAGHVDDLSVPNLNEN